MEFVIKKVNIFPKENRNWENGLYLGMSLNNKIFSNENSLLSLLEYLTSRTNKFSILVGDYLNRYNEQIFSGVTEAEAIEISLKKGEALKSLFEDLVRKKKLKIEIKFISSLHFKSHASFQKKFERFIGLYHSSLEFQGLIEHTIDVYLKRQTTIRVDLKEARTMCFQYLLEELVIFELLAEEGFKVNVYPGNQLPIVKAICSGQLKKISRSLEQIQAVEVKFRPKYI